MSAEPSWFEPLSLEKLDVSSSDSCPTASDEMADLSPIVSELSALLVIPENSADETSLPKNGFLETISSKQVLQPKILRLQPIATCLMAQSL